VHFRSGCLVWKSTLDAFLALRLTRSVSGVMHTGKPTGNPELGALHPSPPWTVLDDSLLAIQSNVADRQDITTQASWRAYSGSNPRRSRLRNTLRPLHPFLPGSPCHGHQTYPDSRLSSASIRQPYEVRICEQATPILRSLIPRWVKTRLSADIPRHSRRHNQPEPQRPRPTRS
jgi:hypothetical protein